MVVFLSILLTFVALMLIGIVLIQESKGGGLSGAFGGAGGGGELLGTSAQKSIAKATSVVSVVFFLLCIAIGLMTQSTEGSSAVTEDDPIEEQIGSGEGDGSTPPSGEPSNTIQINPDGTIGNGGAGSSIEIVPPGDGDASGTPATGNGDAGAGATPPADAPGSGDADAGSPPPADATPSETPPAPADTPPAGNSNNGG